MKSEAIKLKEIERDQLIIKGVFSVLTSEIGLAIIGVVVASELNNHNVISSSSRAQLEVASIGFAAIKAAQPIYPVISQGIKTGGDVISGALQTAAKAAPALLAA